MKKSEFQQLSQQVKGLETNLGKPQRVASTEQVTGQTAYGVPNVRRGENSLISRPFSFTKAMGLAAGVLAHEECKVEVELIAGFRKAMGEVGQDRHLSNNTVALPADFRLLPTELANSPQASLLRASMAQGQGKNLDPEHMAWLANRLGWENGKQVARAALLPAQSYLADDYGGTLVKPPEYMGIIPLMRNVSMMDKAGATFVPLPPQGKAVFSRQTSASTPYRITENVSITQSTIQTGQLMLQAKKTGVAIVVPNDLFKFASESADALFQGDMAKSLALIVDSDVLYGPGNGEIKGLIHYTGTNELLFYDAQTTPAPGGIGANGNTPLPQDGDLMMGYIEDRNFDPDTGWSWIMRGGRWRSLASTRASAVTSNDQQGPYVELLKAFGDRMPSQWAGMPVVRSTQVKNTSVKGGATNLTQIWGGLWNEMLIGMYGAMEFARGFGDGTFLADQTIIRGITYADAAPRYPGAFVVYDDVLPY